VVSECVLAYLPVERADPVLSWAARFFTVAAVANYEQVRPDDAFGLAMTRCGFALMSGRLFGVWWM